MSSNKYHNIGVLGVRDFKGSLYTNKDYICKELENYLINKGLDLADISLVTGGGKGVESLVVDWCKANNVPVRKIPPNVQEYGQKDAFCIRNNHVVSEAVELVVFWDGQVDMIVKSIISAMNQGKKVQVIPLK